MGKSLADLIPDGAHVLEMEPEELAGVLLDIFVSWHREAEARRERPPRVSSHDVGLSHWVVGYPRELQDRISRALMEAWLWLENQGFVAPTPGEDRQYGHSFLTKRASQ